MLGTKYYHFITITINIISIISYLFRQLKIDNIKKVQIDTVLALFLTMEKISSEYWKINSGLLYLYPKSYQGPEKKN